MKKLFRFQYEKCNGTCYTGGDDFYKELENQPKSVIRELVDKIVAAHDSTCDDPNQRFGIDYDEENKIFIGSFLNNMKLDIFSDKDFVRLVDTLMTHVLSENTNKVINRENCVFGLNGQENLAEVILNAISAA